jgi:hypothetical protein
MSFSCAKKMLYRRLGVNYKRSGKTIEEVLLAAAASRDNPNRNFCDKITLASGTELAKQMEGD